MPPPWADLTGSNYRGLILQPGAYRVETSLEWKQYLFDPWEFISQPGPYALIESLERRLGVYAIEGQSGKIFVEKLA